MIERTSNHQLRDCPALNFYPPKIRASEGMDEPLGQYDGKLIEIFRRGCAMGRVLAMVGVIVTAGYLVFAWWLVGDRIYSLQTMGLRLCT